MFYMANYYWYLICEVIFVIMGCIFASGRHPLSFAMVPLALWMMIKAMKEAWKERKKDPG